MGLRQAETLAHAMAGLDLKTFHASDLTRAMATLCPAASGRETSTWPELREVCLGRWEGLTTDEVSRRFPGEHELRRADLAAHRPAGGESFEDVLRRALPVLEHIARTPGRHLVVAHGGVNRALLCALLGMPLANLMRIEQDYCHVSILVRNASGWRVAGLNIPPSGPFPIPAA